MLIPLRHIHADVARPSTTPHPRATTPTGEIDTLDAHLRWTGSVAGAALRGLVLLGAVLSWEAAVSAPLLAAALLVAGAALTVSLLRPAPFGLTLAADASSVTLLLLATGGAASPFLALPLALVGLGWLAGGWREIAAGTLAGAAALVLVALVGPASRDELALGMAAADAAIGAVGVWTSGRRRADLAGASEEPAGERPGDDARRALEWQRQSIAALEACASTGELRRRTAERAMAIAGAAAAVGLPGEPETASAAACIFTIPGEPAGRLAVHAPPQALDSAQRDALEHLATLAGMRARALVAAERLHRQQDALVALWEAAGVVRAAADADTLRDAFRRLASALGLDWLALVGPDDRQPVAALVLAQGRRGEAPRLHGAQLRVAAETLRSGRPLVRAEGDSALVCLPMRLGGETTLALLARGDANEAATQALLMVFGDLVAAGMAEK